MKTNVIRYGIAGHTQTSPINSPIPVTIKDNRNEKTSAGKETERPCSRETA